MSTDFLDRYSQRVDQNIKILLKLLQFPSRYNMHRYSAYIVIVCKFTIWKSWKYHTNSHTSEPGVPTGCSRKYMYYNQIFHNCNAIAITKYTTTKYFTQRWVWSIISGYRKFHDEILLRCWVKHASGERKKEAQIEYTSFSQSSLWYYINPQTSYSQILVMWMWGCWNTISKCPTSVMYILLFFAKDTSIKRI